MQCNRVLSKMLNIVPDSIKANAGEKAYEVVTSLRAAVAGAKYGRVSLEGERDIAYYEIDRGKAETIVFLHGFADSKESFFNATKHLVDEYNIICPDLPGFGKSFKRRNDRHSLENYGDWISSFIEELELRDFHLAGNSLGGAVAAQVALNMPERVKTLTLVDPAGVFVPEPYGLHHELFDGHVIFDVRNRDEFEYFLRRVFTKPPFLPHPIKDFFYKEFSRHGLWHRKVLADLINGVRSVDDPNLHSMALNQKLKHLSMPTFLIWGEDDSFFPKETALVMHQEIPDCQIHFLSDIGHCPQIEDPEMFSQVFRKYLHQQCIRLNILNKQNNFQGQLKSEKKVKPKASVKSFKKKPSTAKSNSRKSSSKTTSNKKKRGASSSTVKPRNKTKQSAQV